MRRPGLQNVLLYSLEMGASRVGEEALKVGCCRSPQIQGGRGGGEFENMQGIQALLMKKLMLGFNNKKCTPPAAVLK